MNTQGGERRRARLYRRGGSLSVTLPKVWLEAMCLPDDEVELVHLGNKVVVEAPASAIPSIEEEPEFPAFLQFVSKWALAHPDHLVNARDVMGDDAPLFAGVDLDV